MDDSFRRGYRAGDMSTTSTQRLQGTAFPRRYPRLGRRGADSGGAAPNLPVLYVKSGCIWCAEVIRFLMDHGIGYQEKNVNDDGRAFVEMKQKSGQNRAPTLDWHGKILSDFGVEELKPFLREQEVEFEES